MKKILFIIAALLIWSNADAQLKGFNGFRRDSINYSYANYSYVSAEERKNSLPRFILGEYVFVGRHTDIKKGGGTFVCTDCSDGEIYRLYSFIKEHKDELEKKFNVIIKRVDTHYLTSPKYPDGVQIEVYDKDTYKEYLEYLEKEKEARNNIIKSRRESLNHILE